MLRDRDKRLDPVVIASTFEGAPGPGASHEATTLVELREVSVDYPLSGGMLGQQRLLRAVDRVSLAIPRGGTLGLVGGTASGKTTLGNVVMGMTRPTSGTVVVRGAGAGHATGSPRRIVQVVMQDPFSSLDPRMKVRDIIAEPLTLGRPTIGRGRARIMGRVDELLQLVGLPTSKADLYPHQFSGGQRQRIAIARALAPEPQMVVLDEPTSALDVSVRAQIMKLLKTLQEKLGVTYLMISHDLISVAYIATSIAVMFRGRVVEVGATRDVYRNPRHPYTLLLLASAPTADGAFLKAVQAATPSVQDDSLADVSGCKYASRCSLRSVLGNPTRCAEEDPDLMLDSSGHGAACHFMDKTALLTSVS